MRETREAKKKKKRKTDRKWNQKKKMTMKTKKKKRPRESETWRERERERERELFGELLQLPFGHWLFIVGHNVTFDRPPSRQRHRPDNSTGFKVAARTIDPDLMHPETHSNVHPAPYPAALLLLRNSVATTATSLLQHSLIQSLQSAASTVATVIN